MSNLDSVTDALWKEAERQIPCGAPFPEADHIDIFIRYREGDQEYEQRCSMRDMARAAIDAVIPADSPFAHFR